MLSDYSIPRVRAANSMASPPANMPTAPADFSILQQQRKVE